MATGDQKYLDECEKDFIPNFPNENQSPEKIHMGILLG